MQGRLLIIIVAVHVEHQPGHVIQYDCVKNYMLQMLDCTFVGPLIE